MKQPDYAKLDQLPPLLAILLWDTLNDHITKETLQLAKVAVRSEFNDHELTRLLAGGNSRRLSALTDECEQVVRSILEAV